MTTVFHEGELALQERTGTRARLAEIGPRVIRDHMPQQHRDFFAQLPFLIAGSVDAKGQPWASVLAGPPGFVRSPDDTHLAIDALPLPGDPLGQSLKAGAPIGLLGIEPHTRRRNRANGRVLLTGNEGFVVTVEQSFGNCPKYIQAREPNFLERGARRAPPEIIEGLDSEAVRMIAGADTFFIATAHPSAGADVSHRGGRPGFVAVDADACVLTVPDYIGNSYFNTLGNIAVNPRCGLAFIDFESGDLLYLAARGTIVHEARTLSEFPGAQRLLHLQVESAMRLRAAVPLAWGSAELSPVLPAPR